MAHSNAINLTTIFKNITKFLTENKEITLFNLHSSCIKYDMIQWGLKSKKRHCSAHNLVCKRNLLSYSPGSSMHHKVGPVGCIWEPHFGGRGGRRGSVMVPFKRAMVVSYRLSIVTIVLYQTIPPQFAIKLLSDGQVNRGMGHFWAKFWEGRVD